MSERSAAKSFSMTSSFTLALISFLLLAGCGGDGGGNGAPPEPPPPATPTITLAAPAGASVNRTVELSADVTAPAGVTRVEFLVDDTVVETVTDSPFTFAWDTSAVADGEHSVAARVTDDASNVVTSSAVTVTVNNHPSIEVALSPDEVIPVPNSTASGSGELTFDLILGEISGSVTLSDIDAVQMHIHQGYAGVNGPIIVGFVQDGSDPNLWAPAADSMLTAEQINDLLAGKLYVNAHSAAFPAGEIRAQIRPENIEVVFTQMSGDEVVPPVSNSASGMAATTVDSLALQASVHVNTTGVDDADAAHVHKAEAGANSTTALITLETDSASPGHWAGEGQPVTTADLEDFDSNGWYVDVHTPANPEGALRGQITPNPTPPPQEATLTELQAAIFTPRCASCHNGSGGSLPGAMNLSSAQASFDALVNVASLEQPAVLRVDPGNPDDSYLVHKLEGAASISGSRMPLGGPFLDQATIDEVRSWIEAGAQNN